MIIPPNLATDDIISEAWVDAVTNAVNNAPWGFVGSASIVASSALVSTGTPTDIAGMSVTFTAVAGRRYKVWAQFMAAPSTTPAAAVASIADGAGTQIQQGNFSSPVAGGVVTLALTSIATPPAGPVTYKLRLAAATSATVQVIASPTFPAWIAVEDIGPVTPL